MAVEERAMLVRPPIPLPTCVFLTGHMGRGSCQGARDCLARGDFAQSLRLHQMARVGRAVPSSSSVWFVGPLTAVSFFLDAL